MACSALTESTAFAKSLTAIARDVDAYLQRTIKNHSNKALQKAMVYAAMGGKKLRPWLVCQTTALCGGEKKRALPVAAAVECVHAYSLVHDDLPCMDDAAMRRGKPSVYHRFGETLAVLCGDALLTHAFTILLNKDNGLSPLERSCLGEKLARASEAMVEGQVMDTSQKVSRSNLAAMYHKKTGALMVFSCVAGAHIAKATTAQHKALENYATYMALAFQIHDDLLDTSSQSHTMGKSTQRDENKKTYLHFHGAAKAQKDLQRLSTKAIQCLDMFDARADFLRQAIKFAITRQF